MSDYKGKIDCDISPRDLGYLALLRKPRLTPPRCYQGCFDLLAGGHAPAVVFRFIHSQSIKRLW